MTLPRPAALLPRACGLALLGGALAAAPGRAQVVEGGLVDRETGLPIERATVVLVDSAGVQRRGVLADSAGAFRMEAPGPGLYTLWVERIGYRTSRYPAMRLRAGEVVSRRWAVAVEAVTLEGVAVVAERRCEVRPTEGVLLYRVWEEARKALNAMRWTEAQALLRYDVVLYDRLLDERRRSSARSEQNQTLTQQGVPPFRSLPAADLARLGYVRAVEDYTYYYAPDANVLLSDEFLDAHCFRLRDGRGSTQGMIGLSFEPVTRTRNADVRGTLWIDRATAELRFLEYGYTGHAISDPEKLGGRVEFGRLPDGPWYVREWWIRWPRVRATIIEGYREVGGRVVAFTGERTP